MRPEAFSNTIDARVILPGIDIQVRTYRQSGPLEHVLAIGAHTLCMSLTPRVMYSRCYLDARGRPGPWVDAGDITFSPRGVRMLVRTPGSAGAYRGIYCSFASPLFEEMTGLGGNWSPEQLVATLNVQSSAIKRDLYRIVKEVSETALHRETLVEATARVVMVELARYLGKASEPAQPACASLAGWQMRRVTDYVEGMIDHCPSVDELARLCDLGPRQLTRAFKASTGRTVGDYVKEVRMIKAQALLADTQLSQKEIAYRLGFSGPSSFCATFGKAVGMTPKQFRDQHK